jgi:hypothetical protein
VHRLLSKDLEADTAVCAACGPVTLYWRGAGRTRPRCAVAVRAQRDSPRRYLEDHGLTRDEARAFCAGKLCAICGSAGPLVTDHCHRKRKLREPLCGPCNSGLGLFRESPERLRAAALYLERHQ